MSVVEDASVRREDVSWHLGQRIFFRFSFCYIVLFYLPDLLQAVPATAWMAAKYSYLLDSSIYGMIGVDAPRHPTGSGDTTVAYIEQLVSLLLSLVGGVLWSILDRQRESYVRLNGWLGVLARYVLAFSLFSYAFAKIFPTQFQPLSDRQLLQSYGQSSPMGLLWNFMGFSTPYTIFAGCVELVPAVLLVFRRTALLGSLIAFAVLLNIVMLNFCYDVPVKLVSVNLLILSGFLILPEMGRLFRFFILDLPVTSSRPPLTHFRHPHFRQAAVALKIIILATTLVGMTTSSVTYYKQIRAQNHPSAYPLTTRGFHWIQEEPYNR